MTVKVTVVDADGPGYSEPFKQMLLRYIASRKRDMHTVVVMPHSYGERYRVDGKMRARFERFDIHAMPRIMQ